MGKQLQGVDVDERQLGRVEAIVLSMTTAERRNPEIIKGPRRARIAAGSGTTVQQVNQVLQMRKQMEKMMKQVGRGKMPNLQSIVAQQRRARKDQMAAKIRLVRVGSKKNPIYRVVVADSRSPRDGKFIEIVGRYNPQTQPSTIEIDEAKVKDWISKGAQPTDSVKRLMKAQGIS